MVTSNIQPKPRPLQAGANTSTTNEEELIPPSNNNNISEFYRNVVIFLTGATGFVGKALLEKLLRSCDGIKTIYILIRPKKGLGVEQRLKELIKNPVFDRIREKKPEYFDKIRVVSGDVAQPNLGLNELDRQMLTANVNIAFHSAATVRFNESLKDAVVLNTLGTKRVVQLCRDMKNLKSFIHVSTAYSNADKREIEEIIYPPPYDPISVIHCVETLPPEAMTLLSEKLLGKHPNTYTLTKAMAEHIVLVYGSDLPVAIVRPSIVTAAWKEPFPGWVDNVSGITGIMMEIGRGTIKSIICDETLGMDLIPVDLVANTLVTAAWHISNKRCNKVRVYNCTSGQVNGISWRDYGNITQKYALEYPSRYISWYPGFRFRTNRLVHWFCHWMYHTAPAALLDVFLYCTKHKPIMLRICKKFANAAKAGEFFALNEWNFATDELRALIEAVKEAEDGENFNVDMSSKETENEGSSGFDWDPYVKNYMLGIRQYVLKDDLSTLPAAKAKLQRIYWSVKIMQAVSIYMAIRFAFR